MFTEWVTETVPGSHHPSNNDYPHCMEKTYDKPKDFVENM